MLRNFLRCSRWLAPQIVRFVPVVQNQCFGAKNLLTYTNYIPKRLYSNPSKQEEVQPAVFEEICNETLESLCDYFEEILEESSNLKGADVTYSDGVLTIALNSYGTYVINRQTPNKQIWLSSPTSGPKRYDLVLKNGGYWVYKHDGVTLHQLLQSEISKIVNTKIDFSKCSHSLI